MKRQILLGLLGMFFLPAIGLGASHREAPFTSLDQSIDITDVYAFRSPEDGTKAVFIMNVSPFSEPGGGPNFYSFDDEARYQINIDNDGDSLEDVTFQFAFRTIISNPNTFLTATGPVTSLTDPDLNVRQVYDLKLMEEGGAVTTIITDVPVAPWNIGLATTPNYDANLGDPAITNVTFPATTEDLTPRPGRVFTGPRDDPFFVDIGAIFDAGNIRDPGLGNNDVPEDALNGFNVNSIAIEVPIQKVTRNGQMPTGPGDDAAYIGVWATATLPRTRTLNETVDFEQPPVQVSRMGNPFFNELVIGTGRKDRFNATAPVDDGQFISDVLNPAIAPVLDAIFGDITVPTTNRFDLEAAYLLGFAGFNSRPSGQDAPGDLIRLNLGVDPTPIANASPLGAFGGDNAGYPNGRRISDDVTDIILVILAGQLFVQELLGIEDGVSGGTFSETFPFMGTPNAGDSHAH
ncbi:MAG: DUF4331 domain-containing protein [Candidatus Eisenbacteria bacterium]|uniref:DUF4331 domain-containing protein n=1 Tax=Eiseniibacteriota bacterium TaxID=2212470 RepID=A0A7Y2E870_UNCEI|nr:DUF4331 domain-containing protein [Candidatus Eisenbacteria bacterium]